MTKDKGIRIPVSEQEKEDLVKISMKYGYRSLAGYMRDKALNKIESDEIKTLKAKNKKLMKLIKEGV